MWPFPSAFIFPSAWRVFVWKHQKVCCSLLQWYDVGTVVWCRTCTVRFFRSLLRLSSSFPPIWVCEMKVLWKVASSHAEDDDDELMLNVLRCHETYWGQVVTNAEAWCNKSLRPRKPEGSLGRTAQDVHLDSHTAPELWPRWRFETRFFLYFVEYSVKDFITSRQYRVNVTCNCWFRMCTQFHQKLVSYKSMLFVNCSVVLWEYFVNRARVTKFHFFSSLKYFSSWELCHTSCLPHSCWCNVT